MQQDVFNKWVGLWASPTAFPSAFGEQAIQVQKKWGAFVGEVLERQRQTIEAQFRTGLENIEMAFKAGQAKSVEEMRGMSIELWRKCFDSVRQASEAQMRDFQAAMEKWVELSTKAKV
jgi:hypothetical protein